MAFAFLVLALASALVPAGLAYADDDAGGDGGYSIAIDDAVEGGYYLFELFEGTFAVDDDGNVVIGEATVDPDIEETVASVLAGLGVTVEGYAYDGSTGDDGSTAYACTGRDDAYTDIARANNLIDAIGALSDEQAFADALAEALSGSTDLAIDSAVSTGGSVVFSGLGTGYYLVVEVPTEGADAETGAVLVPLSEDVAVRTKTEVPTPTKEVAEVADDGTCTWGSAADAQAGEAVPYRITGTLPSDWAYQDSYYYCIYDVSDDGIVIDADTITVTLLDAEGDTLADLTGCAAISYEDGTLMVCFEDLVAAIDEAGATATADCTIQVSYEADVSAEAVGTGTAGAMVNSTYIVYGPDRSSSIVSAASLYAWALQIAKIGDDTGKALEGAMFTIQDSSGAYVAADGSLSEEAETFTTDDDGIIAVAGLDAGTYMVTETAAPEGYQCVDPFSVTIVSTFDGDDVTLAASADDSTVTSIDVDAGSGVVSIVVEDPSTGLGGISKTGDDSWWLILLGLAVLAAGIAAIAVAVRRRSATAAGNAAPGTFGASASRPGPDPASGFEPDPTVDFDSNPASGAGPVSNSDEPGSEN